MMRASAPAKVNLRLKVLNREASGYHSLETLFCAISLTDELELTGGPAGVELEVEGGIETGALEQNLAVRAARRFHAEIGTEPALKIRLSKRIPAAAGLGGGSSDCAAVLRALNEMHGRPVSREALLGLGAELGSDVPFFLCGSPLAWAWSRGERLLALPPLPARPVLIGHPRVALPTAQAFRMIAELRGAGAPAGAAGIELRELTDWTTVAALAENDLQSVAIASVPRLRDALAGLRGGGASVSLVAGSGASVFGVFESAADRDAAESPLAALGFDTWRAETLQEMPDVGRSDR